ncbi:bacillithiol biosynthesis deacetylase BshB2 [Paenibacillus sp. J31TS4]|uniref:bacillithiol biosynthesis deacetylase BshB2 n=1 Tax=Paenibacillus sp. J31TS4 TaxID=2807195 RepID=UPI001BCA6BEF|nr:bacillithiol biosynthesis deacetylase BshB2 [Paenibacillus sp. J31TS4]
MEDQHILVVLPHPDDEAFGLSGTLAKHIENGAAVTYACLTLGEMGRNMGNPPFASRISLPKIRLEELQESCRVIGIQDLRTMGFHDKMIEFEDQDELDRRLRELLDELKPGLVYTFYPGYAVHPDHDATGAAVVRVIGALPEETRPVVRCLAFAPGCEQALGAPDVEVDVSAFLKQKTGSIRAHRSQFRFDAMLESNSPEDRQMIERLGKERFWTWQY